MLVLEVVLAFFGLGCGCTVGLVVIVFNVVSLLQNVDEVVLGRVFFFSPKFFRGEFFIMFIRQSLSLYLTLQLSSDVFG